MFGIGSTELLVILVIALLVLGPKNLPKIAQTLGKAMGQFQRVSKDFQRTLNTEVALEEEADKRKEQERLIAEQAERQKAKKEQNATQSTQTTETTAGTTAETTVNTADSAKTNSEKSA